MKKLFTLIISLITVCAFSVSVFAAETVIYSKPGGEQITSSFDPWDGFGIGEVSVNGSHAGDTALSEIVKHAEQDALLYMVFSTTGNSGNSNPEIQFNCWDDEENRQLRFEITDNGDGTLTGVVNLGDVLANYRSSGGEIDNIRNLGVQLWTQNFKLHKLYITASEPQPEPPASFDVPDGVTAPADKEDAEEAEETEEEIIYDESEEDETDKSDANEDTAAVTESPEEEPASEDTSAETEAPADTADESKETEEDGEVSEDNVSEEDDAGESSDENTVHNEPETPAESDNKPADTEVSEKDGANIGLILGVAAAAAVIIAALVIIIKKKK